jgi:hypothetical protein
VVRTANVPSTAKASATLRGRLIRIRAMAAGVGEGDMAVHSWGLAISLQEVKRDTQVKE